MSSILSRREFVKRGLLFVPAFNIFVPTAKAARRWIPKIAAAGGGGLAIGTPSGVAGTTGTTTVHALTGQTAGTRFVVIATNEGHSGIPGMTITDNLGTPLTYTLRASNSTSNTGNIFVWTSSAFTAGGSITITVTINTTGQHRNSCVVPFTGMESGFTTTVPTVVTGQTTANISATTPTTNCYVVFGTSDYSANAGAVTYRNGESVAYDPGADANFHGFHYYKLIAAASTASYGTTAPTTTTSQTTAGVVIRA